MTSLTMRINAVVTLLMLVTGNAYSQSDTIRLLIQEKKPGIFLETSKGTKEIRDQIFLARVRQPFVMRANNVVSAFYSCAATATSVDVPAADALKSFASSLGPFLSDLTKIRPSNSSLKYLGTRGFIQSDDPAGVKPPLSDSLARFIRDTLLQVRTLAQTTIQRMAEIESDPGKAAALGVAFVADLVKRPEWQRLLANGNRTELQLGRSQLGATATERIKHAHDEVNKDPTSTARDKVLEEIIASGDEIIALGYDTDIIVNALAKAKDEIRCGADSVSMWHGKKIVYALVPRTHPMLARGAAIAKFERVLTVQPDWLVRPSIGLSAYYAPRAQFDKFATTSGPDGMDSVFVSGKQDARLMYGVTLGVTTRYTSWRPFGKDLTLWTPELLIKPDADNRSLGLGAGMSLSIVKFGAGIAWIKTTALKDQRLGTLLSDGNLLSTRDVYSRPKGYFSFSLIGLPPFLKSDK